MRILSRLTMTAVALPFLLVAAPTALCAQDTTVTPVTKPRSWLLLPNAYSTPETGVAGGVLVGWYDQSAVRPARQSSATSWVTLTMKRQATLGIQPELFLRGGTLWVRGEGRISRYPDVYYGIGGDAPDDAEEEFSSDVLDLSLQVQREVRADTWLGLRTVARHDDVRETEAGGLLAAGDVPGSAGGTSLGIGIAATRDTRDSRFAPRRGGFQELSWTSYGAAGAGDFRFSLARVDLRRFQAVGARTVLALQATGESVVSGDAPLQLLPRVGGSRILRGYRDGRFRDRHAAAVQGELRRALVGPISATVFGGVGGVGSSFGKLGEHRGAEHAVGAGLRYRVNASGVNARVDYARGRGGSGLYITLGEAF